MNQIPSRHLFWYPGHELLLNPIERAENCNLYDTDGKRYIDLEAGVWCTSIGHSHPRVLAAIQEQAAKIAHTGFGYSSEIVQQAAEKVLSLLGFENGKSVFLCSGSEAVEYGVRVAQAVISRPLLMTMTDSYFGAYGSASNKDTNEWYRFDWSVCSQCPHGQDCSDQCDHWAAIPFDRIGGFLFEPGSSSGLVRFPPRKLLANIATEIKKNDGLILVNEVTTGIGRTGTWFGYQHYDLTPDIVAMGKGIGNGYPVSVAAFSPAVVARKGNEPIHYAQSHQNDPLGAAVVIAVLDLINSERLIERATQIAETLLTGLMTLQQRSSRIQEVRARGLMVAIELEDDSDTTFTTQIHRELIQRGFVLARRPGLNVLRMDPSLTIDPEDISSFLDTLNEVLKI